MSNTPVSLLSCGGILQISPIVESLKRVLQFRYTYTEEKIDTFRDKNGEQKTIKKRGRIMSQMEPLYSLDEASGVMNTHDGMLHAISDHFTESGIDFQYNRCDPQWPVPIMEKATFKGLHKDQRDATIRLLLSTGGGMVEGATGSGKTHIIIALIRAYKDKRVLIMTKSSAVVRGLHKKLNDELKDDNIQVGIIQGANRDIKRINVATNRMVHIIQPEDVDVLIVDECHTVAGNSSSEAVLGFRYAAKYGLSATINKRFDGKEKFLEGIFGPIVYQLTDQEAQDLGRVAPIRAYFMSVPEGPSVDNIKSEDASKRHGIWFNSSRNRLIGQIVDRAPENHQLLVFVETIQHLDNLMAGPLKDKGFEVCHGDLPNAKRLAIEKDFTSGKSLRLISTDCLSTGVDPKNLRIMIDASAVLGDSAMVQKRGRLRRLALGKTHGVLIQFADEWSEKFGRRASKRMAEHKDRGDIVIEKSTLDDLVFDTV